MCKHNTFERKKYTYRDIIFTEVNEGEKRGEERKERGTMLYDAE